MEQGVPGLRPPEQKTPASAAGRSKPAGAKAQFHNGLLRPEAENRPASPDFSIHPLATSTPTAATSASIGGPGRERF